MIDFLLKWLGWCKFFRVCSDFRVNSKVCLNDDYRFPNIPDDKCFCGKYRRIKEEMKK